jgi:hypothetical protein
MTWTRLNSLRVLMADVRIALLAFTLASALTAVSAQYASAQESCPPGSPPATGCNCSQPPPSFHECGCCTTTDGYPACLWCRD